MGNGISSFASNPAGAVGGVWNDAKGSVNDGWNGAWQGIFGKHGGGGGGGGAPDQSVILRPDQMRQMGNQFSYRGAPPGMPQGMQVIPQAQRQMMMQQMQQQQMQQMQPTWDQNAYNPNQNMMMRQQQMQQPNYQNMGMFGHFNPYMPRR